MQLRHRIGKFWICPYTDMPRLPSWCTTTYSLMAEVYTSSYGPGKHRSLFFCLSVTQSQNKQSPMLLNVLKFHLIDAGKQFSQNQQLKVKLIHFLVDRPMLGTYTKRGWSHDLVTQNLNVSCNDFFAYKIHLARIWRIRATNQSRIQCREGRGKSHC